MFGFQELNSRPARLAGKLLILARANDFARSGGVSE